MTSRLSIRGYWAGFLFVVALFAAVAVFTLWNQVRTHQRVDQLVETAFERSALIATLRVDAALLEEAVNDHIRATTEEERQEADEAMDFLLSEIRSASDRYTHGLARNQTGLWQKLNETSQKLVNPVRTALKYSTRREAERARKQLEEVIRPITWELEETATELTRHNAERTQGLLRELEALRLSTTFLGSAVSVVAVLLALFVGWRVSELLRRQEKVIADQVAELDRRNQELDAFASRVAHDLVSPLSPLKGYLTLLRRSVSITAPQDKEMLAQAEESAARMNDLIEALLRFCRAGRPSEHMVADWDTAVGTILLEVSQSAAAQGVALERLLEPNVPVSCPPQLLQSIAQNLLSNAVKYSAGRPGAKVTVRLAREKGWAVLEVSDNGVGMSEESQRQLFQPFFRAPEARALPGHGLGMATTKRLVEAHGGSLELRSTVGAGTQVTVRLPLANEPAAPPPAMDAPLAQAAP
ncbi:MAG: sensor histidine kinase [Myxococcota bacterium]